MHKQMAWFGSAAALACLVALSGRAPAEALGWGNVKGQVVYAGGEFKPAAIKVDKDQGHCLSRGPLMSDEYVVNPKNNGVRWVLVWLIDPASPLKKLPTHPALAKPKKNDVVIDQPCCKFEPHVLGIREGQVLVAKNSAPIAHNVNVIGGEFNPNLNQIIPPNGQVQIDGWKAAKAMVIVQCSIHGWMKSWLRVFNHPYFAVTDENGNFEIPNAPAGKYNLVTWHEGPGWVKGTSKGVPIEIEANKTTDVGKIDLKPGN
jgi:hypothetical protein